MQTIVEPAGQTPASRADAFALRAALAFVWLATGLGVLHPYYQKLGAESLAPLGLPPWVMVVTCIGEIVLGLRVLLGRVEAWLALLQGVLILGFSLTLTATQPALWLHPLGVLTKNLPLLAILLVLWRLDRAGWDAVAEWSLRVGMAVVWLTDGVAAQVLYGLSPAELARVQAYISPDAALSLRILGVLSAASGVAVLSLRGRPRRFVLLAQVVVLAAVPVVVSFVDPLLWVDPFGPLTKNAPLLVGTWILFRRVRPPAVDRAI